MRKLLLSLIVATMCICSVFAQVTTSSISGNVSDVKGSPLVGATVVAKHVPSGTTYGVSADAKGNFRMVNLRPGGPYSVTVQMLGFKTSVTNDIEIPLGDNYVIKPLLAEDAMAIDAVVVTSGKNSIMNSDRTGTMTNINSRELSALPSVSRSITDFTRLTPQAGADNTFAGRDGRYNNLMIDGASFNNRFGLSTGLPGGAAQPISLDAIQELTVNISPFDIRESSFTGASINAITRSGDNTIKGSVYSYWRPKSFTGEKVGDGITGANGVKIVKDAQTTTMKNYGFSLGGPIVKDKLFLFVTAEMEDQTAPGIAWVPTISTSPVGTGSGDAGTFKSRTTTYDLDRIKNHLISTYGYNPGSYNNFSDFEKGNYKITARLDWNINKNHQAMLRYNEVKSNNDQMVNSTSTMTGLDRASANRYSADAFTFSNANYGFEDLVRSITGEINSKFSEKISNKFLASYTFINTKRTSDSDPFPFVDIKEGGKQYMSFGYELFSYNNDVANKNFSIVDNVTISMGDHTITAGAAFEYQNFKNAFQRGALGYYLYNSVDDFINNVKPAQFGITYPYGTDTAPAVELSFGMASLYVQDEWLVNKNLKVTGGIRFEMPMCFNDLQNGTQVKTVDGLVKVSDITWVDGKKYDLGEWTDANITVSPRVGFNWDVYGDRSLQLRGGTGLFSGYVPFVWYTNQPNTAGFVQSPEVTYKGSAVPDGLTFKRNFKDLINDPALSQYFSQDAGIVSSPALAKVADDFKLPQVWRTSLAADLQLPNNFILTLEAMYTKDVNAVVQENVNLAKTVGTFAGSDNRPVWWDNAAWTSASNGGRFNSNVTNFTVLKNSSKGYQALLTVQLTKKFSKGLSGMIAYTYNKSKDTGNNPGSTAASAWSSNTDVYSLNNTQLGYSLFSVPNRVNGYVSYTTTYLKHLTSTFSLYYSGSSSMRLNYVYSNDMNGDGYASDLMYIPKNADDIKFIDQGTYTAAQQSRDFFEYINANTYLKDKKGKYVERGGGLGPWVNRFDFKFAQDVFVTTGKKQRYTLQFTVDVLNVGNLLNPNWGLSYTMSQLSYNNVKLLTYKGTVSATDRTPTYTVNGNTSDVFKNNVKFNPSVSTASTWGCMMGLRLKF